MSFLGNHNTIGLFLGTNGICRAVKMVEFHKEFEIIATAECCLEGDNQSEQLKEMINSLSPADDTLVIAGSDKLGNSVDLIMPKLAADDLRSALQFEVPKYTPLADDDVIWGYRVIRDLGEKGQHLRLGITPAEQWEHVIGLLSSVNTGIEMIMPPAMALDPAFGDMDYCSFEAGENQSVLTKGNDGIRESAFIDVDPLESSFKLPANISSDAYIEHDEYLYKASLLAVYGLSSQLRRDHKSWIKVPQTIQSKRRLSLFVLNMILLLVLAGAGIYTAINYITVHNKKVAIYNKHIVKIKKEIAKITVVKTDEELLRELETQMRDVMRNRPGLSNNITILTNLIDDVYWADRFSWNGERFTIGLKTDKDDSHVATLIEDSGYFENVTFKKETTTSGKIGITLEMLVKEKREEDVDGKEKSK